eukprot:6709820-Pyramimonas_sp.AAC.1
MELQLGCPVHGTCNFVLMNSVTELAQSRQCHLFWLAVHRDKCVGMRRRAVVHDIAPVFWRRPRAPVCEHV